MTDKIDNIFEIINSLLTNKTPHEDILKYIESQRAEIRLSLFNNKFKDLYGYSPEIKHSDIVFLEDFKDEKIETERNTIFGKMIYNASQKINPIFEGAQTIYFNKCGSAALSSLDIANAKVVIEEEILLINPKVVICCSLDIAKIMIYNDFNWENDRGKIYSESPLCIALNSCYQLASHPQDEIAIKKEIWEGLKAISDIL